MYYSTPSYILNIKPLSTLEPKIPSIVHYVWVGSSIPDVVKARILESQKNFPDASFQLWDDSQVRKLIAEEDVKFLNFAYNRKAWAFVSDYIKCYALNKYGGFAMDTDNIILRSLTKLGSYGFVSGFENYGSTISPITALMGSRAGHPLSERMLEFYSNNDPEDIISMPNTRWISQMLYEIGILPEDRFQYLEKYDVAIFPSNVLSGPDPLDFWNTLNISSETLALHLFDNSWYGFNKKKKKPDWIWKQLLIITLIQFLLNGLKGTKRFIKTNLK